MLWILIRTGPDAVNNIRFCEEIEPYRLNPTPLRGRLRVMILHVSALPYSKSQIDMK